MSSKKLYKIVLLQDDFPPESVGGAGMVAALHAQKFHELGHEVSVIAATQNRAQVGKGEWRGIPVYRVYSSYPERFRAWKSLYNRVVVKEITNIFKELNPDIVHAHNVHYHLSYASLKAAKNIGAKVFLTAHDAMLVSYGKLPPDGRVRIWKEWTRNKLRYNPLRNIVIKRYLQCVTSVCAVSNALKVVLERGGIKNITVIHNSVDLTHWAVEQSEVSAFVSGHTLAGKMPILFGGRISPAKGGDAMLAALPHIVLRIPNAVLLVVGKENEYTRSILNRAQELGVKDSIVSLGWLSGPELLAAYHAACVVVQPSVYFEPFGLIALEAMACKKPVVASPFGGLPEIVVDTKTGYLRDPRIPEQFAAAVISLLENKEDAAIMGNAGCARAQSEFSPEKHVASLIALYEK